MKYAWLAGFLVVSMVSARGSADEEAATPADDPANTFLFTTNSFTVKAGTERFLCHAITLKEDLVVDRYSFPGAPYVHHLVLARTVAPEPEGMSECDILFRTTWLPKGHKVRVTCNFDNTTDKVVTFGESTTNEMCFFLVYAGGVTADLGGCLTGGSSSGSGGSGFLPANCGKEPPNNLGLGAPCSQKGGECKTGLSCSADLPTGGEEGVCLSFGKCKNSTDCGDGGATCCALNYGDAPINLCLAKGCSFSLCTPL